MKSKVKNAFRGSIEKIQIQYVYWSIKIHLDQTYSIRETSRKIETKVVLTDESCCHGNEYKCMDRIYT